MRLIDADALEYKLHELYVQPNIDLWQVISIIRHIPTIDAEPVRHGRWEYKSSYMDDDFDRVFEYSCSICGRCIQFYNDIDQYPYCHCGAKMDLEVQDELRTNS